MKSTPDQERRRRTLIQKFDRDWEIRLQTKEIARKKKAILIVIFDYLWRRQKVRTLYQWAYDYFHQDSMISSMMSYDFPLKYDDIQKPKQMKTYFSLQCEWTIPKSDLKYLLDGPLFTEDGEILVKAGGSLSYYFNILWRVIVAISIISGLAMSIFYFVT